MSREEPAIDLDRALNYAVARVELSGRQASNEPVFVISAENPRLKLESPLSVGSMLCAFELKPTALSLARRSEVTLTTTELLSAAWP